MPENDVYKRALYLHPHPINILHRDGSIWRNKASEKMFSEKQIPVCKQELVDKVFAQGAKVKKRQIVIAGKLLEIELTPIIMNGEGALTIMEEISDVTNSNIDPLTGVYNRKTMEEFIVRNIELAKREESSCSVIMLDIDNFKPFNDTYGHTTGDYILSEFGRILKKLSRKYDLVFRYGGEEFLILLPKTTRENAFRIAERMRRKIELHEFSFEKQKFYVTASVGVGESCGEITARELIKVADNNLYVAKEMGRNIVMK